MNEKKSKIYIIMHAFVIVALLVVIGITLTYAYISTSISNNYGTYTVSSSAACISLAYSEADVINLDKRYPLNDTQGAQTSPVKITVKNDCSNEVNYSLFITSLKKAGATYMDDGKVKIKVDGQVSVSTKLLSTLTKKTTGTSYTQLTNSLANRNTVKDYTPQNSYYITSNTTAVKIASGATHTYNVRLWIDYTEGGSNNSTQGQSFAAAFTLVTPGVD